MQVTAATMHVAHTFEVVRQAKVATVVRLGDANPVRRRCVDGRPNPKPGPICMCGAGCGLCSCTWLPLLPFAWGVELLPSACGVSACRRGDMGGGRGRSSGTSPAGRVISSGRKFPVASAFGRLSKFVHLTLFRLSNVWWKLSLNSCWIKQRRAVGKVGCWQACALSLRLTMSFSSRKRNILYVARWTLSYPSNTVQKTAHTLSWDKALSQPAMGTTFCFPISRLVSVKEVKVPPPKIASHSIVITVASNPAKGERSGNKNILRAPPTFSGS